jgi:hypothetical protein
MLCKKILHGGLSALLQAHGFNNKKYNMNTQIKMLHNTLKKWNYYQELKELSIVTTIIFSAWFLLNYGKALLQWLLTETGTTYAVFFMASVVIGIAIKIYYRVMVIKYHEKDTNIELFKELNTQKKQ